MRRFSPIVLVIVMFGSAGIAAEEREFSLVSLGSSSSVSRPKEMLIRSEAELDSLLPLIPHLAIDGVDFSKEMLIAVFRGRCSSGGNRVYIESLSESGRRLIARTVYESPGRGCMTTKALTYPFALYRTERTELKVSFTVTRIRRDCE
jgi:hypothetical protein